jgi:8-amino-7-oxononanoate synthase
MKPLAQNRFENELKILSQNSQIRNFPKIRGDLIDLSSNSYLNLHKNPQINERAKILCENNFFGSLASRLVMQNTPLFEHLEECICKWKNCDNILVFNSGFTANLGIIQALANEKSAIFSDRLNHASIIDGIRLSGAKHFRFNHLDYEHLEKLLKSCEISEKLIVSDAVFSMDGDIADVKKLAELAENYGAFLLIDEAHSIDFDNKIHSENLLVMGTLSKAAAGLGAYLQCSDTIKKYLINRSRPLIFSTALPQSVLAWDIAAIEYLSENRNLGKKLLQKAQKFRQKLKEAGINFGQSESQIIPIIVKSNENALNLSKKFLENKIYIPAIRPPTVPANSARCRISLNLGIDDDVLEKIILILKEAKL